MWRVKKKDQRKSAIGRKNEMKRYTRYGMMVEPKKYSLDLDTWTVVIISSSISFAAGK
jgi:hypothetical protein